MKKLKNPPSDFVNVSLFKRIFKTVILILKNPKRFYREHTMESTPWSAYLFATTYMGLITVIGHGIYLFVNEKPLVITKFLLILMLDYFCILIMTPLFILILVLLFKFIFKVIGNKNHDVKIDFKVILNIIYFATVCYPTIFVPQIGIHIFLILFYFLIFTGISQKKPNFGKNIVTTIILYLISFIFYCIYLNF